MQRRFLLKACLGLSIAAFGLPMAHGPAWAVDALQRVKASGVLKVGTETAFAPFDFINESGEHIGLNVDAFDQIARELGVKLEWVTLPWDGVLPALEAGQFDMVAGPATITKKRAERYRFLSPIADATMGLLKAKGNKAIGKPEDIAGKTVGAGKGTAALLQVQAYGKTLPTPITTREYVSFNEAYADLAASRIAVVVNSLPNITYVAEKQPDTFEVVTPPFGQKAYFGFLGTKKADDQPLLDAVQAALVTMRRDGRLAALQGKWFGTRFETPDVAPEPAF